MESKQNSFFHKRGPEGFEGERVQQESGHLMTAIKRNEMNSFYTQDTPKPRRSILLFGEQQRRHLFPLVRDRDIGIPQSYQNVVIESFNDDDRQTTSTQLQRGMAQTVQDLYEEMKCRREWTDNTQ